MEKIKFRNASGDEFDVWIAGFDPDIGASFVDKNGDVRCCWHGPLDPKWHGNYPNSMRQAKKISRAIKKMVRNKLIDEKKLSNIGECLNDPKPIGDLNETCPFNQ